MSACEAGTNSTWFTEADLPYGRAGVRISVEVTATIVDERTPYGHLQILDTTFFGRMLIIDGIIQVTESDEFVYHEMMVLLPGLQVGAPRSILIAGGGDGGALKQALRFDSLTRVVQVEIDDRVARLCAEHLPTVGGGAAEDPRAELVWADAYDYVASSTEQFDLIVADLTDPVTDGPAERLFGQEFLELVSARLAPGGVLMMQCGSLLFQPEEIRDQYARFATVFATTRLHTAVVPSYQLSSFGFLLGSHDPQPMLDDHQFAARMAAVAGTSHYLDADTYRASTAVPAYLRRQLVPTR